MTRLSPVALLSAGVPDKVPSPEFVIEVLLMLLLGIKESNL